MCHLNDEFDPFAPLQVPKTENTGEPGMLHVTCLGRDRDPHHSKPPPCMLLGCARTQGTALIGLRFSKSLLTLDVFHLGSLSKPQHPDPRDGLSKG